MSLAGMNAQAAVLLEEVPRGGIAQNMYRMMLQQCAMNSLGPRPQVPASRQAIHRAAARVVRQEFPGFRPVVRPASPGGPTAI